MAYLFDDASSQHLRRATLLDADTISLWFWPDDLSVDCTLLSVHNALGTVHKRLTLEGSVDDRVRWISQSTSSTTTMVASGGTVNINEWNHVIAMKEAFSGNVVLSLNGESLQTGSFASPGAGMTTTSIGRNTGATPRYMSGRIGTVGLWPYALNDYTDAYQALADGVHPYAMPIDTSSGSTQMLSLIELLGNLTDLISGVAWTSSGGPTVAEHHRVQGRLVA